MAERRKNVQNAPTTGREVDSGRIEIRMMFTKVSRNFNKQFPNQQRLTAVPRRGTLGWVSILIAGVGGFDDEHSIVSGLAARKENNSRGQVDTMCFTSSDGGKRPEVRQKNRKASSRRGEARIRIGCTGDGGVPFFYPP